MYITVLRFSVESLLSRFQIQGEIIIPESFNAKVSREVLKNQLVILRTLKRKLQQNIDSKTENSGTVVNICSQKAEVNKNNCAPQRTLPKWISTKQNSTKDCNTKAESSRNSVTSPSSSLVGKNNSVQKPEGSSSSRWSGGSTKDCNTKAESSRNSVTSPSSSLEGKNNSTQKPEGSSSRWPASSATHLSDKGTSKQPENRTQLKAAEQSTSKPGTGNSSDGADVDER